MVHVNGLCRVRNSAQGTMLGGHQVAAVFCCKSICRLVTLIERCFRTVACMCVDVLVHATKFPAMVICLMPTVRAFLSHVCLLDGSLCLLSLVFAFSTREGYRLVSPNTFYAFACVLTVLRESKMCRSGRGTTNLLWLYTCPHGPALQFRSIPFNHWPS